MNVCFPFLEVAQRSSQQVQGENSKDSGTKHWERRFLWKVNSLSQRGWVSSHFPRRQMKAFKDVIHKTALNGRAEWLNPGRKLRNGAGTVISMRRHKEKRKNETRAVQCCYLLRLGPINTSYLREWWKEWESLNKTQLFQRHNSELPNFSFQICPNTSQQDRQAYAARIIHWQGYCHGNMSFVQKWSLTHARPSYLNNRFFWKKKTTFHY